MAFATAKLTEFPFTSHSSSLHFLFPKTPLSLLKPFSSLRTTDSNNLRNRKTKRSLYPWDHQNSRKSSNTNPNSSTKSWINKWPSPNPSIESEHKGIDSKGRDGTESRYFDGRSGTSAIERIVLRLRNLGLGSDDEDKNEGEVESGDTMPVTGDEKLGDLLQRDWVRPDSMLIEDEDEDDMILPWERGEERQEEEGDGRLKRRAVRAPTLAELTIEDEELRRLRRLGMTIRERINVPKAGITQAVLGKIHEKWRKEELVRLKFHEALAHDMKTAHEIVERRTGGLVTWRSGSVMVVFRGTNYEGPPKPQPVDGEGDSLFVPDVSSVDNPAMRNDNNGGPTLEKGSLPVRNPVHAENMTEEEAEYNSLLDGLGPRFVDWWGTGVLPVDGDLLPQSIPGYKTPLRILPTGMRPRLTNAEMTNLRKLAKSLPCHFALGRNRNHQGLAAAIIKLWEKSIVVKIAVKPGIQNTNNKLMAEEIKNLTGGVLLLRNKYYIVIYRGKDFLPTSVAAALSEREELTKHIQVVEEKVRTGGAEAIPSGEDGVGQPLAGTLAEFYEAQARWGREISAEEHEKMIEEASRAKSARVVKRIEHKLALAQAKKLRAERLLAKIEASMIPAGPSDDQETITDEERFMFRRLGLRMKAYLLLGVRGVFDGVIENMHLHWKHRELVKLISKQKTLAFVEDTARLLEYESGGILVAIERVPKGYALIYYRGKNYRRPVSLRPRNLLTKAKALKRSVAMQRHEALSQHISELERTIEQMKMEIGDSKDAEDKDSWSTEGHGQFDQVSEVSKSEDEASGMDSDADDVEDIDWKDDEESGISRFKNHDDLSSIKF
ncbi:CRM-domain containing factor CFM3, chloroplastic/mitochondrial isoform X1 [Vitis vinifera]|uniref:CRM-domain containing factor CFM3, chloroplastic/mitochondrial isoform X1 n=1 Tax=Vitis vinifera TaxID=29760 RepID=UPI00053FFE4A|nr:CRM-domain containing factor CFM3, chloroplastic/mitochondrial isoform X1 [Vitis vinifera]|eukprot:XP_010663603.1 PREDICTED: CRM-domain containing factor CFM3, chloroplastic/mitochondrial isoform X1 [Vitis vinifera]